MRRISTPRTAVGDYKDMLKKLPPMNTLHAFAVVAHRLNFSQAGEELKITHAAVGNQMKRLEQWFGRKLFERSGRESN